MSLPIVFRRIARQEMDESIAWYESERRGVGIEFASDIENLLARIADKPEKFSSVRGDVRRAVLRRFPYTIISWPSRTGSLSWQSSTQSVIPQDWQIGNPCSV
jgi:hypothetical protein